MRAMLRLSFLICACLMVNSISASGQHRMVSIGDRRLSIDCDGRRASPTTVVLMAGGGRTRTDWAKVQTSVSSFARVCSYDRAGLGDSDKASDEQSVEEIVDDLHALLEKAGEKPPFLLVAHSMAGFHARRFSTKYLSETAGLVFVDSSHEEQALRLHELDPQGPPPDEAISRFGFYVKPGQRLEWRTRLPLIVIRHGKPFPRTARDGSDSQTNRMTEEQWAAWDRIWRGFQEDLAKRSTQGQLRLAEQSGHMIPLDQPEVIVQAIRDLSRTQ